VHHSKNCALMSQMGQQRRFRNVRDESAYPPLAALKRTCRVVAFCKGATSPT
jgi:hypothetical protein